MKQHTQHPESKKNPFRKVLTWVPRFITHVESKLNHTALEKNIPLSTYVARVFYACLCITLLSVGYHTYKYNVFERHHTEQLLSKFNTQLDETFHRYFSMLYGMRAMFSISPDMTLKQWQPYANQILYPKRYPGIHGLSLIRPVMKKDLAAFLQQEKNINQRSLKILSPENDGMNELNIIQYSIAHKSKTSDGLNIRQYENARKALDRSRDTNQSSLMYVPKFRSQNLDEFGPVFMLYTPIYMLNTDQTDVITRRQSLYGWVSSSLYIQDLFHDVLNSDPDFRNFNMSFSIKESKKPPISLTPSTDNQPAIYPQTIEKTVAGLTFNIHTKYHYNGPALYGGIIAIPPSFLTVLIIALFISFLTTAFFWSVLTMRQRALNLASRMTTDMFRQEQRHKTLIQNAPGVIFSCTAGYNWHMNYLSDQFQDITGYSPKEFLDNNRRYIEIVHPDDILKIEKTIGLKPKANHEYFLDYRIIHKNGTVRWMHERAKVVRSIQKKDLYLTGHFFDITDQKTKESDYRNLVNALENAVNGVALINEKGYHLQVNEAYSDIINDTPKSLQYKSFFDFIGEKDKKNLQNSFNNFKEKNRDFLSVQATSLDGKTLYLHLVIVPAYSDDAHKKITGFYLFVKDVSNEMRRENQLSEAVKAAEAANQTKSTFLATMSHELRTPLNAIIGYSDMLLEDALDQNNDVLGGDLKKINASGRHLLTLINDILDVSKLEAGKMTIHLETFDIQESAQNMMDMIYHAAEKNNNTIELTIPDDVGEMYSDLTKLRQMVFNLLSNACKFTKDGVISMKITPLTENNREFIAFAVSDSGIGITEQQMQQLFKPFVQADTSTTRNFGGTGLGLTITKKFSEMLGGSITVSSDYGKGTTFTMTLPRNTRQDIADDYNFPDTTEQSVA